MSKDGLISLKGNFLYQMRFIVYRNRFNEVKAYEVEVKSVSDEYIKVFDVRENKHKTFKKRNIHSTHLNFEDAREEAQFIQKNYTIIPKNSFLSETGSRKLNLSEYEKRYNINNKLEVCFTGFSRDRKSELCEIARHRNMFVRPSVTNELSYLVCGSNAGPSKLKKAESLGVKVLTETEWLDLIS